METDLGLLGGGESGSAASVDEAIVEQDYMGMSSSSEGSSDPADAHLELGLGLGLSLGCGIKPATRGEYRRFFTAKDLPSALPSHPSSSPPYSRFPSAASAAAAAAVSGTKRSADNSAGHEVPSPAVSQVLGWPPIRAYRMNNLVNQAKALSPEEEKTGGESYKFKDASKKKHNNGTANKNSAAKEKGHLGFVKVNIDGVAIGRKVDMNAHDCYQSLAQALEDMFFRLNLRSCSSIREEKELLRRPSRLLDGSSEFVLTYEDKEGDWMLVGDIPWEYAQLPSLLRRRYNHGMFLNTVRRLRIMKTSEANGLGSKPI